MNIFTIETFIFTNFVRKIDSVQSQFQRVVIACVDNSYLMFPSFRILEKVVLKLQKFYWTNIFTTEIFIFASFVRKINFERSRSQKVAVAPSQFL